MANNLRLSETTNRMFSRKVLVVPRVKDSILKEVTNCVIRNDEERLKNISPYNHLFWRNLSIKDECLCIDERIVIRRAVNVAVIEDVHSTHPSSFAKLSLGQNIWWPYIHRDIPAKDSEYKACTKIGTKFKPEILHSKRSPKCIEPNDELEIDIARPLVKEKEITQYFSTGNDCYSQ